MPKWRTTVVNPGNLEADNKRVWLLPQAVTKTQKTRAKQSQVAWEQLPYGSYKAL